MLIIAKHSRVRSYSNVDVPVAWDEGPFWELLECPTCDGILLRKGYWHEVLSDESGPDYELLYPAVRELIRGLPEEIKKAYAKAMRVRTIDSNAFAVMLGRVLDLVCIDKKAEGESLFDRLKYISDKNVMPQQLADMAHALRHLRNFGAHADLGELTEAEVPILEGLSRAILEYVYSAPALVQLVQTKIDELKSNSKSKNNRGEK